MARAASGAPLIAVDAVSVLAVLLVGWFLFNRGQDMRVRAAEREGSGTAEGQAGALLVLAGFVLIAVGIWTGLGTVVEFGLQESRPRSKGPS